MNTQSSSSATPSTGQISSIPKQLPYLDLAAAFIDAPPSLDFVFHGFLKGSVGSLVAPGAAGKSWVATEIAVAVAGGADLLGLQPPQTGRVLMVAAEDPSQIIQQRIHTLGKHINAEQRLEVVRNLTIAPTLAMGVNVRSSSWVDLISKDGADCRLIVIDTLSRVHDGDENNRTDASLVMRNLELIASNSKAAVLFLHHAAKAVALSGQADSQQASRGSSVWVDEARWVAYLKTMDEKEAKKLGVAPDSRRKYVRFGTSKQNYGVPMEDLWLQRTDGGLLLPAHFAKGTIKSGSTKPVQPTREGFHVPF